MKICTKCKRELPDEMFHKYVRRGEERYSSCRDCKAEYRDTPERKEAERKRSTERRVNLSQEDKQKRLCWNRVYYWLKIGRMKRPPTCEQCGVECTTQAHHADYSKPFDVTWCCQECHAALDNERRTRNGQAVHLRPNPGI